MNKHYTFIAYKPDHDDTCRGCLMASYSSDCIVKTFLSEEELINEWVGLRLREEHEKHDVDYYLTVLLHDPEMGTYILKDDKGIDIGSVPYVEEAYKQFEDELSRISGLVAVKIDHHKLLEKQKADAKAEAEKQRQARDKIRNAEIQEEKERQQLAKLKAKYES